MSVETEVKLGAPASFVLPEVAIDGLRQVDCGEQTLRATYFDTPDRALLRDGITFRHRTRFAGDPGVWTLKLPLAADRPGRALRRTEIEIEGSDAEVPAAISDVVGGWRVSAIAVLVTRRRTVELRTPAGEVAVEIVDDVVSAGGAPFRELEVELKGAGDEALLDRVVRRLRKAGAGEPDATTKLARALEGTVRAAGGVVWRRGPKKSSPVEVLLVHRPKYDDWTIPKGKLDAGESDLDAAVREVAEETGLGVEVGRELPPTAYVDGKGRPKVVRYWAMTVVSGQFEPSDEVDEIVWLPVAEAIDLLTYQRDVEVVEAVANHRG